MKLFIIVGVLWLALASMTEACAPDSRITELAQPGLVFPQGLTVAPDGAVWIASTQADRLVRFDPASGQIREIQLTLNSNPIGIAVDSQQRIWFAARGRWLVGRLREGAKRPAEFPPPSLMDSRLGTPGPSSLALDDAGGHVWFTLRPQAVLGYLPLSAEPRRDTSPVREIPFDSGVTRPEGLAADGHGGVWIAEMLADRLTHLASDGTTRQVPLPPDSRPRGVAVGPGGDIWVTLFGTHELARIDPHTLRATRWPMPSGSRSSPWPIAVDRAGHVWVGEYIGNRIVCFDPKSERFASWDVPTPGAGIRALAVDGSGRVWFVGSFSGRLGVIGPRPR